MIKEKNRIQFRWWRKSLMDMVNAEIKTEKNPNLIIQSSFIQTNWNIEEVNGTEVMNVLLFVFSVFYRPHPAGN